MYSFDHQGTGFEGEHYYDTNHYAPSWSDNQYQYDDQYYYNEGNHYESFQHEKFGPQEYQYINQNQQQQQGGTSNIESMIAELMMQNKNLQSSFAGLSALVADSNAKYEAKYEDLAKTVEQLAKTIAATEKIMNERVEMEMASHQETQVHAAETCSPLLFVAVGDGISTSLPSKPDPETEQHVELKKVCCEDLADVCPYESKMDPQENSNLTVEDGCEVWKPSFSTVEYTRSTLVGAEYEDVYLSAPPPDKFQQFFPYIFELPKKKSHDPTVHVEAYILKGSRPYFHFILHGRKFKWDLKVD